LNLSKTTNKLRFSTTELRHDYDVLLELLATALEVRTADAEGHTIRVADLSSRIGRVMGLTGPQVAQLRRGALVHDIGNLRIPESLLQKTSGLTALEWVTIHMHPFYGYELLAPVRFMAPALDIPYCHHEKWNGSGYPRGLKGDQIPLVARIFAVADVWDALTHDRPYLRAWGKPEALEQIQSAAGEHFDPAVITAFLSLPMD
jgi:HD-GYP domain-containing protein (c-di-GMP phosphodiesterase class II)